MLAVIILFVVGFGVGLAIRRWLKSTKPVDWAVTVAIWLLLFVLGAGVGANRLIMENIHKLGLWAFIISLGAVVGSIAVVMLVQHFFFKKKGVENEG